MSVAKTRMLRWVYGKTQNERIKNEIIREHFGVATIDDTLEKKNTYIAILEKNQAKLKMYLSSLA